MRGSFGPGNMQRSHASLLSMGGRLPAVAGMPANRTFLELSAGQSDWPEKNCVVLLPKKRMRPIFVLPRRKAIFPMESPSSQHKKRSLPSDIHYFPFALVNYSVTPTLTCFRPRWNSAANQRAQHCAGKGRRQSVNEYSGWRHTMARSYGIAVGLLVWKLLFLSLR